MVSFSAIVVNRNLFLKASTKLKIKRKRWVVNVVLVLYGIWRDMLMSKVFS